MSQFNILQAVEHIHYTHTYSTCVHVPVQYFASSRTYSLYTHIQCTCVHVPVQQSLEKNAQTTSMLLLDIYISN